MLAFVWWTGIANRRQKKKTIAKLKALEQALDTAISSTWVKKGWEIGHAARKL